MDELDRYVNHFVEKYSDVKDFRFLHPYLENDTICFSTRDESRLAALNLALPSLVEKLKEVGINQEIVCKKVEENIAIETAKVQVAAPVVKQNRLHNIILRIYVLAIRMFKLKVTFSILIIV